jgi:hypothetical protein
MRVGRGAGPRSLYFDNGISNAAAALLPTKRSPPLGTPGSILSARYTARMPDGRLANIRDFLGRAPGGGPGALLACPWRIPTLSVPARKRSAECSRFSARLGSALAGSSGAGDTSAGSDHRARGQHAARTPISRCGLHFSDDSAATVRIQRSNLPKFRSSAVS